MARSYPPFDVAKPFGQDLWIMDGPEIRFLGVPFSTRATIVRLADGSLWFHSPIRWSAAAEQAVGGLGEVAHLIAPNWIHYAYLDGWKDRFPQAEVWAAPGVEARARKKGIPFPPAQDLGRANPWAGEIETLFVAGSAVHRECVFFHHASATLILTDLIENVEAGRVHWFVYWIAKVIGVADPDGKMPADMAMSFRKGRAELARAVQTMIDWAPQRIVLAHGRCYEADAVAELRRAFRKVL